MKLLSKSLIIGLSAVLISCGQETSPSTDKAYLASLAQETTEEIRASALDIGYRTSAWQFANMDNFDEYIERPRKTGNPTEWIQGALYVGATRWAETVDDEKVRNAIEAMAKGNDYELGERLMHGDDHVVGQSYMWLYEQTGNKEIYAPTQKNFDEILEINPTNSLEFLEKTDPRYEGSCQARWCWSDALFMAPRTWLKLTNATGDNRYFDYADKEFWAVTDYLFSKKHGLYFRDSRYFDMKSDNGAPVFWSRGNGWVFAALPLIIDDLPMRHPSRARYIKHYKKMAKSLVKVQKDDGFWAPSLMDAEKVTTPETSGTGFVTFGLAWGVNNGILTDEDTINAVNKGWAAIRSAVDSDGKLHWVQQIGKSPDPVKEEETQLYGVGAVLLASTEMMKWEGKKLAQPEPEKKVMAFARYVPERQDDFAWENDKVAFRVYGPAAPLKGHASGVDIWLKNVDYSIIDKWYADFVNGISYHVDKGEGYDPYHTGVSRGTGGSAVWVDGKAYYGHNFISYEVLKSGGDELAFTLQYEFETPLGLVHESKTISLALGERLFTSSSIFTLDGKPAVLPIAVGVTTHNELASVTFNEKLGRISAWETMDGKAVGTGVLVDTSIIKGIKHIAAPDEKDISHIWIFTSTDAAGKLSYKAGFAWEGDGEITTSDAWDAYLDAQVK